MNRDKLIGFILIIATTATWGGAWVTARAAAHDAPSVWMAVGRFAIAAVALLPIAWLLKRPIQLSHDKRTWWHLVAMALSGAIGYNLFFLIGIEKAFASDGAVITPGLSGFAGVLFVWLIDKVQPRKWAIVGGVLAIAGATIIGLGAWQTGGREDPLVGFVMFALASVVWGFYTAMGRRISGTITAVEGVFWTVAIATMFWAPIAWIVAGPPQADWAEGAYWNMLYLGLFATSIGFVTWYLAVKKLGADRAGPGLGLVPVFGVALAVIFLDETLQWSQLIGGLVVVFGIALSAFSGKFTLNIKHRFDASRDEIWARVTDYGGLHKYSPDLRLSEIIEGEPFAVGAVRRNYFAKPQGKIEFSEERITKIGDYRFEYDVAALGPYSGATGTWTLAEDGAGCKLVYQATLYSGFVGWMYWPLTKRNMRAGLGRVMENFQG